MAFKKVMMEVIIMDPITENIMKIMIWAIILMLMRIMIIIMRVMRIIMKRSIQNHQRSIVS